MELEVDTDATGGRRKGTHEIPFIVDVCVVAAEYCDHLTTRSLARQRGHGTRPGRNVSSKTTTARTKQKHRLSSARSSAKISEELIQWRRQQVREWIGNKNVTTQALASTANTTESAIRGFIREDRTRFSIATRNRLLAVLGISVDDWDGVSVRKRDK